MRGPGVQIREGKAREGEGRKGREGKGEGQGGKKREGGIEGSKVTVLQFKHSHALVGVISTCTLYISGREKFCRSLEQNVPHGGKTRQHCEQLRG